MHIAKSAGQGSGKIIPQTDTAVTFTGNSQITIAKEDEVYSDVIDFSFDALEELAITIYYGQVPQQVTGHPGLRTITFQNNEQTKNTAACDGGFDAVFDFDSYTKASCDENKLGKEKIEG